MILFEPLALAISVGLIGAWISVNFNLSSCPILKDVYSLCTSECSCFITLMNAIGISVFLYPAYFLMAFAVVFYIRNIRGKKRIQVIIALPLIFSFLLAVTSKLFGEEIILLYAVLALLVGYSNVICFFIFLKCCKRNGWVVSDEVSEDKKVA